ncbi:MAG: UDP-glucose/GDP-mannose dehydrogenase family protein [Bdellovibrionota bacterium]
MKISVFGTGYVGLVSGVCFAEMGNTVIGVDVDEKKIASLKDGVSPIYEPGLDQLLQSNYKSGRIDFTTNAKDAINNTDIIFIAVGTPPFEDGSADLKYVLKVAETIAEHMNSYKLIVTKSTVPVGTYKKVKSMIEKTLKKRNISLAFDVASNPEFLREGCAIDDCMKTSRVVVGVETQKAKEILKKLYEPFLRSGNPFLAMDPASSEMTKYAANAMLATKISLMNEFSRLCEKVGADIDMVRHGIGADHRIGPYSIYAGIGYGGSCFPKDVMALIKIGTDLDENLQILTAVEKTNALQRRSFIQKIASKYKNLSGLCFTLWGVAFKPGTDDIREAPAIDIISFLLKSGATVRCFDPAASENTLDYFKNEKNLSFFPDQYEALDNSVALIIPTEWKSFRNPDFNLIKSKLKSAVIFDGRNIYKNSDMKDLGIEYYSIGRPHYQPTDLG